MVQRFSAKTAFSLRARLFQISRQTEGMNALAAPAYISEEEYRLREETASQKHEWFDGELFPMPGGTDNHTTLCFNLNVSLGVALQGSDFRGRNSEQRVKIEVTGLETYPDALIYRKPARFVGKGNSTLLSPKVIFEVLSPSTESYDRRGKFEQYKRIETLTDYILVAQDSICVEHFLRRGEDWLYRSFIARADVLPIESVAITLALDAIYDDLDLPEPLLSLPQTPSETEES